MAWRALIEALLGLTMLVALGVEGSSKASPLHRHLDQELKQALLGFTTAFPGDMVEQDLDQLSDGVICAAAGVAEQAWIEVRRPEESGVDVGRFLREKWSRAIRPSLLSFIWGPASPRSSETRSRP
ncbi:hypothetical protein [Geothrix sp.]|jgi:hypothetical protein|uniref:hypothetical protein n=1 Tax=Geothrix sp. TaxID=1962974 RepID=UPI0025BC58D6|nr:hypothetical protein [Geothrix sp.]